MNAQTITLYGETYVEGRGCLSYLLRVNIKDFGIFWGVKKVLGHLNTNHLEYFLEAKSYTIMQTFVKLRHIF